MAEDLPAGDHVDHVTLVIELHRAVAHHVEELSGGAILHEDSLAFAGDVFHDRRRDAPDCGLVKVLEGRVARQEPGSLRYAFRGILSLTHGHGRLPVNVPGVTARADPLVTPASVTACRVS